ncbi:queuosine precursor transporter [Terrilactibacillus laevilacticus]|uniref:Probable queuosine precursor transporter n=1 Tax=Terrilactibacillus laevilacticus TaxID=1380157 RepID=A0ABW5PLF6_9BACI|nr:queuosine precursor transporter [Terrilactibacillus laevilacticus]
MNQQENIIDVPYRLITLAMLFVTCLITANLCAVKLFSVGSISMTSPIIFYPLTFIILDSMTEIWGKHVAKRIIWIGFLANVVFIGFIQIVLHLPAAPFWHGQQAMETVLGSLPRTVFASLVAYLCSQTLDVTIFSKLKQRTQGRMLWLRSIASTASSQLIDSIMFMFIAFIGVMPLSNILTAMSSEYILKFSYSIIGAPLIYLVVFYAKRTQGGNKVCQNEAGKMMN